MLAEHFHDPAIRRQLAAIRILGEIFTEPSLLGHLIERGQAVGCVLVRTKYPEVRRVTVRNVTQVLSEDLGRTDLCGARLLSADGILLKIWQPQRFAQ